MYIYMYVNTYIHIYIYIFKFIYICVYVCMYESTNVCMVVRVCVHRLTALARSSEQNLGTFT